MALFNVLFDIAAKTASFESSMKNMERQFTHIGEVAKKAGELMGVAFTLDYVKESIKQSIEFGDAIGKASAKSGIAAEQISALAYATKQLGDIELPQLSEALKKMQVNLTGTGEPFNKIGLNFAALKQLSPEQQFATIAQRISEIRSPAERTAAAVAIFGKAGADLLPAFSEGAEGIRRYVEQAKRLGISIDTDQVAKLQAADEAVKTLSASYAAFARRATIGLAAILQQLGLLSRSPRDNLLSEMDDLVKRRDQAQSDYDSESSAGAFSKWWYGAEGERSMTAAKKRLDDLNAILRIDTAALNRMDGATKAAADKANDSAASAITMAKKTNWNSSEFTEFEAGAKWLESFAEFHDQVKEEQTSLINEFNDWNASFWQDNSKAVYESMNSVAANSDKFTKKFKELNQYEIEAARSTQQIIADTLMNGFDGGIKGILKSFAQMLLQIEAQAEAAKIAKWLFGDSTSKDSSQTTGVLSGVIGAIFGGFKAGGGGVYGNKAYVVGEQGPELFMPGASGTIVPNDAMTGGGTVVHISMPVDARGATIDAIEYINTVLPQAMNQTIKQAVATVRDSRRRGTF